MKKFLALLLAMVMTLRQRLPAESLPQAVQAPQALPALRPWDLPRAAHPWWEREDRPPSARAYRFEKVDIQFGFTNGFEDYDWEANDYEKTVERFDNRYQLISGGGAAPAVRPYSQRKMATRSPPVSSSLSTAICAFSWDFVVALLLKLLAAKKEMRSAKRFLRLRQGSERIRNLFTRRIACSAKQCH